MNAKDIFYHGIRDQIRRVLTAMGPDRVDAGMTAFEDGSSDWSNCFFARAYPDLALNQGSPEAKLCEALGLTTTLPLRTVWVTFDSASKWITRPQLKQFINDVLDESRPAEVMELLRSLDASGAKLDAAEGFELRAESFCAVD